jgi:ABC-type uncharacterized transport system fused permease/ATPase subunit
VRVRENAESIAFYGGQTNEMAALTEVSCGHHLQQSVCTCTSAILALLLYTHHL